MSDVNMSKVGRVVVEAAVEECGPESRAAAEELWDASGEVQDALEASVRIWSRPGRRNLPKHVHRLLNAYKRCEEIGRKVGVRK